MDDVRIFGCCECCGQVVTDEDENHYVNDDGEVFCSIECVLEHYCVTKREV